MEGNRMTREEHLALAKERAMEYWNEGDLKNAVASMLSDLSKHPEIKVNKYIAMIGILYVSNGDASGVRYWIGGFR